MAVQTCRKSAGYRGRAPRRDPLRPCPLCSAAATVNSSVLVKATTCRPLAAAASSSAKVLHQSRTSSSSLSAAGPCAGKGQAKGQDPEVLHPEEIRHKGRMPRELEEVLRKNRWLPWNHSRRIPKTGCTSSSADYLPKKRRQYESLNTFWTFRLRMEVRSQHHKNRSPYQRAWHSSLGSLG